MNRSSSNHELFRAKLAFSSRGNTIPSHSKKISLSTVQVIFPAPKSKFLPPRILRLISHVHQLNLFKDLRHAAPPKKDHKTKIFSNGPFVWAWFVA